MSDAEPIRGASPGGSHTEVASAAGSRLEKVSIVMPSYNQVAFIEAAIESVLNQDYENIELIVVDGGSTDGTVGVLEHYRSRIAHCVSEPDQGQSDALNKGFALASGSIYGWLNSDDLYAPNAVATAVAELHNRPGKSVVFGDWLEIDEHGKTLQRQYAFDFSLPHLIYEGFHINAQSMFWRADAHARFGGFAVDLHRTMDYQLILRLGQLLGSSAFVRVPKVLGCFRRHAAQKTTGDGSTAVQKEHRWMAATYGYRNKYHWTGRLIRFVYRLRRGWWYAYRGGIGYLGSQLLRWAGCNRNSAQGA